MTDTPITDEEILVALRNIQVQVRDLVYAVSRNVEERAERYECIREAIMRDVMESDEHQARMGIPCEGPIVIPAKQHQFAEQQETGGMCCDDEPPSREP